MRMVLALAVLCMPPQKTSRPYACARGSGRREELTPARSQSSLTADPHQNRLAWVSGTPFDRPVVPPVYSSAARSVPDRSTIGPESPEATASKESTGTPGAAESGVSAVTPGTMTNRTPGAPASAPATFGRNSAVVTTPTAPESARACRNSSSLTRKSSGVTTAPARHAAL